MITKTLEMTQEDQTASYQMIKDEHLASLVVTSQTLAGSKINLSSYQQVIFSDCVFDNCNFEFSHIRKCKFKNCSFNNCTWKATSTINTIYVNCVLDQYLSQLTEVNDNETAFTSDIQLLIAC